MAAPLPRAFLPLLRRPHPSSSETNGRFFEFMPGVPSSPVTSPSLPPQHHTLPKRLQHPPSPDRAALRLLLSHFLLLFSLCVIIRFLPLRPAPPPDLWRCRRRAAPRAMPLPGAAVFPVFAVHAAEPAKTPAVKATPAPPSPAASLMAVAGKWTVDSWRGKKALQLPKYTDAAELESVLRTIESFLPIVFAGEARHVQERLREAAVGRAFLLLGGDCAESFKEFNANNIRDTF